MKIPPLRVAGVSIADCDRLIPLAQRASSMQGNPVKLSDAELPASSKPRFESLLRKPAKRASLH